MRVSKATVWHPYHVELPVADEIYEGLSAQLVNDLTQQDVVGLCVLGFRILNNVASTVRISIAILISSSRKAWQRVLSHFRRVQEYYSGEASSYVLLSRLTTHVRLGTPLTCSRIERF